MTLLKDAVARLLRPFGGAAPTDDPRIARRLATLAHDRPSGPPSERKAIFRR